MWPFRRKKKKVRLIVLFLFLILAVVASAVIMYPKPVSDPELGVTFSTAYARQLELDWKQVFDSMLRDMEVKHMRIPVYWSDIETSNGQFSWGDYDYMMDQAQEHGVSVTLAIGRKVPRWPECFIPNWIQTYSEEKQKDHALLMLEAVVNRYKEHGALYRWQVENEPFLDFGTCPDPDLDFFRKEVELVRSLDDHPIAMTTSGELEPWLHTAPFADHLGFSLYRVTWSGFFGWWIYPYRPAFYQTRIAAALPFVDEVYVSELQAEPWLHKPIESLSADEQIRMFSPRMLKANVDFTRQMTVSNVDLWGVEWWYFLKEKGRDDLWKTAMEIFNE